MSRGPDGTHLLPELRPVTSGRAILCRPQPGALRAQACLVGLLK